MIKEATIEEATQLLSDGVVKEIKERTSTEDLKEYFKSLNCILLDTTKPQCRSNNHSYIDYFLIEEIGSSYIDFIRFVVCENCGYTHLPYIKHVHLTFSDNWYHSIHHQEEPHRLTTYGKSVMARAFNREKYEEAVKKALEETTYFDNCYGTKAEQNWVRRCHMAPLMGDYVQY